MSTDEKEIAELIDRIKEFLRNRDTAVAPSEVRRQLDFSKNLIPRLTWRLAADGMVEIDENWQIVATKALREERPAVERSAVTAGG